MSRRTLSAAAPLVVAAALLGAGCEVTVSSAPYVAHEEKRFQVTGTPTLSLTTFDGAVEIRSWDRREVLIEVEKRGPDKTVAEAIEVRAEQSGDALTVEVRKASGRETTFGFQVSPTARITATVPRNCNVTARTGDGSMRVERLTGRIELRTGDGSIRGTDLVGSLTVHTGDGTLRLDDVDGAVEMESGDGGARLTGKLQEVRLRTGDGSVEVRADDGSRMTGDWEIRTGDGGLRLELPAAFDANLDASTSDGAVRVQGFGIAQRSRERSREPRSAIQQPLNAGGRLLRLRSDSGTITVRPL